MSIIQIGFVKTIPEYERSDKAQAAKVLEEAAELFAAWQDYDYAFNNKETSIEDRGISKVALVYECADVIIAVCHLLAGLGIADFEEVIASKMRILENR